jgi:hypothetical protein
MSPDDFIMDKIIQPIVDRLPDGVSCFAVARWMAWIYAATAGLNDVLRSTGYLLPGMKPMSGTSLLIDVVCVYYLTEWLLQDARNAETAHRARPWHMNQLRIERRVLTWFWIAFVGLDAFADITHYDNDAFGLGDVQDMVYIASVLFVRAQPRPPGVARKSWVPDVGEMLPAGAGA